MARIGRDHGGGLDAAAAQYGGERSDWLDLSTGINPEYYRIPRCVPSDWTDLPDHNASADLCAAARQFWNVPPTADVLAVSGCSAAIAQIPSLRPAGTVEIAMRSYNEHAAAFRLHGWDPQEASTAPQARVIVHPNNPTGTFHAKIAPATLTVIDESFCDIAPARSHIAKAAISGHILLKSFGKFWGLAGLRLGFAIGDPELIGALRQRLGPWPVSGAAIRVGTVALRDNAWAEHTRDRLSKDAILLDQIMGKVAALPMGDCTLFRTYDVSNARNLQHQLAQSHIWTRIFPYSDRWIRLGMPPEPDWHRLEAAL